MASICFVVNDFVTLGTAQGTCSWVASAGQDHQVFVVPSASFTVRPDGRVIGHGRKGTDGPAVDVDLDTVDVVMVRTNPGRDPRPWMNALLMQTLKQIELRGTPVVNSPDGLTHAASKLYICSLPDEARPRTLVTADLGEVKAFLTALDGPAVIKPVSGTHGQDVYKVAGPDQRELPELFDIVTRQGPAMVQSFVPEAGAGDTRVHLLGGELFSVDGVPALVRRVPPEHDFRSNVHLGGTPTQGRLDKAIADVVALVGPQLSRDGLWHVGLDVIGGKVIEVNAYAPGGLADAGSFGGVDFLPALTERLLEEAARRRRMLAGRAPASAEA